MTGRPLPPLDVNGDPPALAGAVCEGFLLQQIVRAGIVVEPANVVHLGFSGRWHRLYFDHGIVFWRTRDARPSGWDEPDGEWDGPLSDLGAEAGLIGRTLERYAASAIPGGSQVEFRFDGGVRVVFRDVDDLTTFEVIRSG